MYYELMILALVCLAAPSLAKLAGYETQRRPFDLVGIAGIFFLLTSAFGLGVGLIPSLERMGHGFMLLSLVLGWLGLAAGAIWGTLEVLREPAHGLTHPVELKH